MIIRMTVRVESFIILKVKLKYESIRFEIYRLVIYCSRYYIIDKSCSWLELFSCLMTIQCPLRFLLYQKPNVNIVIERKEKGTIQNFWLLVVEWELSECLRKTFYILDVYLQWFVYHQIKCLVDDNASWKQWNI